MKLLIIVALLAATSVKAEEVTIPEVARRVMEARQAGEKPSLRGETQRTKALYRSLEREAKKEPRFKSELSKEWAVKRFEKKAKNACELLGGEKECQ